ncbi:MAG: hypothetical protein HYS35_01635 [Betaproteobacteria bacterium]|nr:hypothetical protein [Betaproteobacteria bacterium]
MPRPKPPARELRARLRALVSAGEVAEIRRRIGKPVMIVDLPEGTLEIEARAGASLVLYYGFSALVQYDALGRALARFKATRDAGAVPGYRSSVRPFEDFMGKSRRRPREP